MDDKKQESTEQKAVEQTKKQPDELGGILVASHIKIFDPETNEVYVTGRA